MDLFDIPVTSIDGAPGTLAAHRGQVLVIINVASKCGTTSQYSGFEALYRELRDQGFSILGFPCDQFGNQEFGTEAEIKQFCATTYDVSFPLFAKVDVNGPTAHPLFQHLKQAQPGLLGSESIKWNFTKFLVGRDGRVLERFGPMETPESLRPAILKALAAPTLYASPSPSA
jgi:glutathione peroxidase